MGLEYPNAPGGIARNPKAKMGNIPGFPTQRLATSEPPETFTYYDLCRKQYDI